MSQIFKDLYQFSTYVDPINLTFHQYLLDTSDPVLVHTGDMKQAKGIIPQIKDLLGDRTLKYIFISHFESDECGGFQAISEAFPKARPICSEVTARQLIGFGMATNPIIKRPGEKMTIGTTELEFISYPSEMHLWEGLLLVDNTRGILFSSDLMVSFGDARGKTREGSMEEELDRITKDQVPGLEKRDRLKDSLRALDIDFVATGHGQCISLNLS